MMLTSTSSTNLRRLRPLFVTAAAVVAVLLATLTTTCHGQESSQSVETFDCYDASVGVTNKTTCDSWCGGLGSYTGTYVTTSATNSGQQFTGLECDCTTPQNKTTDELKRCEGTYTVKDCYMNGVVNKPTCDDWCMSIQGTIGSSLGEISGGQKTGQTCECTDEEGGGGVTEWCASSGNPSCGDAGVDTCDNDGEACTALCDNSLVTSVCDNSTTTTGMVTCTCGDTLTCGATSAGSPSNKKVKSTTVFVANLAAGAIVTFMTMTM